jgi:hypothetical protein
MGQNILSEINLINFHKRKHNRMKLKIDNSIDFSDDNLLILLI